MNPEDVGKAGITHFAPIPQSGDEAEEENKKTETKEAVDPPKKTDPTPKKRPRSNSRRSKRSKRSRKGNTQRTGITHHKDGITSPTPIGGKSQLTRRVATQAIITQGITATAVANAPAPGAVEGPETCLHFPATV